MDKQHHSRIQLLSLQQPLENCSIPSWQKILRLFFAVRSFSPTLRQLRLLPHYIWLRSATKTVFTSCIWTWTLTHARAEKPPGDWGNSRLSRLRRSCARLDKTAMLRRLARWGKCLSVQLSLLWNIDARMISILLHVVSATLWKDKVTSVCHNQYQCQYSPKGAKLQTCWVARPRSRSSLNISVDQ